MSNKDIAQTILAQLGGNRFIAMTGAKNFVVVEFGLVFKLPSNFAKKGINCIQIKLNAKDLYDIKFMKVRSNGLKDIAEETDVFFDMLQEVFRQHTGLDTHL